MQLEASPRRPASRQPGSQRRQVLIVTYTMGEPAVVGVFFRALRLAIELERRGFAITICNCGPIPDDPKVRRVRRFAEIVEIDFSAPDFGAGDALAVFAPLDPDLVVFGEGPIETMKPLYVAARMLPSPFVVLDQYYGPTFKDRRLGVDLLLLYGLRCLWDHGIDRPGVVAMMPPFIGDVTPPERLPVPAAMAGRPWVTILGLDEGVLQGGIDLVAACPPGGDGDGGPVAIALSRDVDGAAARMAGAGLPAARALSLPLQEDAELFGLIAASRAVILANGFMQIMEALALGCPAVCCDRGVGMWSITLDNRFHPFVSIGDPYTKQCERLAGWLARSPFSPAQRAALARERDGTAICADHVESVLAAPSPLRRFERRAAGLTWHLLRREVRRPAAGGNR